MKLMPEQISSKTSSMKMISGSNTAFSSSRNGCRIPGTEKVFQMFADILLVIMLEAAEATGMKQDKNDNNFSVAHAVGLVTMPAFLQSYLLPVATKIPCKNHRPYNKSLCCRLWKHSDNRFNVIF